MPLHLLAILFSSPSLFWSCAGSTQEGKVSFRVCALGKFRTKFFSEVLTTKRIWGLLWQKECLFPTLDPCSEKFVFIVPQGGTFGPGFFFRVYIDFSEFSPPHVALIHSYYAFTCKTIQQLPAEE